jgi:hypothetical protein
MESVNKCDERPYTTGCAPGYEYIPPKPTSDYRDYVYTPPDTNYLHTPLPTDGGDKVPDTDDVTTTNIDCTSLAKELSMFISEYTPMGASYDAKVRDLTAATKIFMDQVEQMKNPLSHTSLQTPTKSNLDMMMYLLTEWQKMRSVCLSS